MKLFWFIPTHGDGRYLGTSAGGRPLDFDYLRQIATAVDSLGDRRLELKALQCLAELGGSEQAGAVAELAKRNPSADVLAAMRGRLPASQ